MPIRGRVIATVGAAFVFVGASAMAGPPGAHATQPLLSPKSGKRLPARPVLVRVKTGDNPKVFRAQLNGRSIGGYFSDPSKQGVRRLQASRSFGLRHGLNRLHVRVEKRHAKQRSAWTRFRIRRNRPLAGAGIGREAAVGDTVILGGRSRSHLGGTGKAATRGGSHLDYSWKLVDAPSGKPPAAFAGANGNRPRITPEVPGHYSARLTVTARDGRTGSDLVSVDATPGPLPQVDTMASCNSEFEPGIRVGSQCYAAPYQSAQAKHWFQVLVLNRKTLEKISNKTYGCPAAPAFCSNAQLGDDLRATTNKQLVIASNQNAAGAVLWRTAGTPSPFAAIGGETYTPQTSSDVAGGFSIIGVRGLPQGQADSRFAQSGPAGGGRMTGYLTPDQWDNYTWLPKERPAFDTRAAGGCSASGCDTITQVGDQRILDCAQLNHDGMSGYRVLVFDPLTLTQDQNHGGCWYTDDAREFRDMTESLNRIPVNSLVMIVSLTTPGARQTLHPHSEDRDSVNALAQAVASVGGTRDLFLRSGTTPGIEYSLVGWAGAGEGNGEETSKIKDPDPGDGRLRGVLSRDHRQFFRPTDTSPGAAPPQILTDLLVQPPSQWPLDGNAGAQAAIRWIGSTPKLKEPVGPNVRSAYWIQGFNKTDWNGYRDDVKELKYPGSDAGFSEADFLAAQAELAQEMEWVGNVRSYMSALSEPFSSETLIADWAHLQTQVLDPITNSLKSKTTGAMKMTKMFQMMLKVVPGAPAKVVTTALNFAIDNINQGSDGSDIDEIRIAADKLGEEMIKRIQTAKGSFQLMGDMIVADYDKLRTVAVNQRCIPTSPTCLPEWQYTTTDQKQTVAGLWKGTESALTQELVRLAFPAYRLTNGIGVSPEHDPNSHTDPRRHDDYWCTDLIGIHTFPFGNLPDRGFASVQTDVLPRYYTYVLANLDDAHTTNPDPNFVPASILQRMFDPVDSSLNPKDGGLGIYAPEYVREASVGVPDFSDAYHRQVKGIDYCYWERP